MQRAETQRDEMGRRRRPRVAFRGFELDLASGDLSRHGVPVRLAAQPVRALVLLVERAGNLVPRSELQQHVWGDQVIEQEQGLNTCIRQIRAALDDRPDPPKFIETVPRQGYRFVAPVATVPSVDTNPSLVAFPSPTAGSPVTATSEPPSEPRSATPSDGASKPLSAILDGRHAGHRRPTLTLGLMVACTVVLTAVALGIWAPWRRAPGNFPTATVGDGVTAGSGETKLADQHLLVVLPFETLGGGAEEEAFALGLNEEITTELARFESDRLGVIARGSVARLVGTSDDIEQIGRELGVDVVLRGSLRRADGTVRIAVQLIRVLDRRHLWAQRFDRPLDDVLEVQLEVAREVSRALVPELLDPQREAPTVAPRAWEAYSIGRYLLDERSPPEPVEAQAELRRALAIDPRLAQAHVALADAIHAERRAGSLEEQRRELVAALAIDPDLASAHRRLAEIQLWADWDFVAAGHSLERAVAQAPGDAQVLQTYALYLSYLRRHDRAIELAERARRLDPISAAVHGDSGGIYLAARRYEQAVEVCQRTLELAPDQLAARDCLLHAHQRLGRHRQARLQAVELMRRMGASEDELAVVVGDSDEKRALDAFFEWRYAWLLERRASPVAMAAAVLPLGRVGEVFEWLERAYEQRSGSLLAIASDPRADAFREDPRFVDLLHRVGFPAETIER